MRGPDPISGETLEGVVEKVVYSNEENHYTVAQLLPESRHRSEPVTIVGNLAGLNVGESVRLWGHWTTHKQFGRQFLVQQFESVLPRTVVGIKKYLGSGLVKGIGPTFANRIVEKFGAQTFDVIEHFSARLRDVEGIGPERARRIKEAWTQQKAVREIMIFLQGHGIGSAHAAKIYRRYGETAITVVRENPYRLARDITGIGFKTADGIAVKLGIPSDSLHRLKAGLIHALEQATGEGHTCLPQSLLLGTAAELLGCEERAVGKALELLVIEGTIKREGEMIFLHGLHRAEVAVAERILQLRTQPVALPPLDLDKALAWVQQKTGVALAPAQVVAVRTALTSKLCVITGGPGVGKTTIVNSIVKILRAKDATVLLAAPTGRAAKRMSEATGTTAFTIHRLLRYDPREGGFTVNERQPLKGEMLIVDETSMLDIPLAYSLLKAVPAQMSLVLVGDVDQLPSVGPGNFLHDLIESGVVPVVHLTEIFRQAKDSLIITNAHRVNQGEFPYLTDTAHDFFFIEEPDPEKAVATLCKVVAERIPRRFGLDPLQDVQVLTPLHRGVCGSENLNRALQAVLNPTGPHVERFGRLFRVGDRVMQLRNNYDKDVFNGDLGRVRQIDHVDQQLTVEMDGREVIYDFTDLDELVPAYAITVHKSQGNEYPAVVLLVMTQHFVMLQRNLVYTGLTRGKKLVILVGSKKAITIAVNNDKTATRYGLLRQRLRP